MSAERHRSDDLAPRRTIATRRCPSHLRTSPRIEGHLDAAPGVMGDSPGDRRRGLPSCRSRPEAPIPSSGASDESLRARDEDGRHHVVQTLANVEPTQIFPDTSDPGFTLFDHMRVGPFLDHSARARSSVSWFSGHVTLALAEERFPDARTLVLLRDPVERHVVVPAALPESSTEHQDLPIEAIYEDECVLHPVHPGPPDPDPVDDPGRNPGGKSQQSGSAASRLTRRSKIEARSPDREGRANGQADVGGDRPRPD